MKRFIFTLWFALSLCSAYAQNIQLISVNEEFVPQKGIENFDCIDSNVDLQNSQIIATYKLTMDKKGKNSLISTFYKLWQEANKLGANSFALENIEFSTDNGQYIVDASVYYLNEEEVSTNFSYYDRNSVVVFGDLNTDNLEKNKSCKINKEKVEIKPFSYHQVRNKEGGNINISVGGFLGSSVKIKDKEGRYNEYLTLGGVSVMPGVGASVGNYGSGVGVGVSISTGTLNPLDVNTGLFLTTILDAINGGYSNETKEN